METISGDGSPQQGGFLGALVGAGTRLQGKGWAFVHAGGTLQERTLAAGELIRVETGRIVGTPPSVNYDIGVAVSLAMVGLAACGPGSGRSAPKAPPQVEQTASKAAAFTRVDLAACLAIARKTAEPSEALCPEFISRGLIDMIRTCADAGGRIEPAERPSLASLDVNGDGNAELLYDATENVRCDGAPSVFSCGSLGCQVSLLEQQAGGWIVIGSISAKDAPALEALTPEPGARYGRLRGGCAGNRPCEEWTYYRWDGGAYQGTTIEVRGHAVDTAHGGGLWTLVTNTPLLASPSPDATVLERYPMGTDVVL